MTTEAVTSKGRIPWNKGRPTPTCPRGHTRTADNTRVDRRGHHRCAPCDNARRRRQTEEATAARLAPVVDLPGEEWRPVVGWEDGYLVSNMGRVRALRRQGSDGDLLVQTPSPQDYLSVRLRDRARPAPSRGVHRLVADAFLGPLPEGLQTRHLNGNRYDNRVGNLAYGTPQENTDDKARYGVGTAKRVI